MKEFTLEKIPTQKLNNSFTLEQNKENVKGNLKVLKSKSKKNYQVIHYHFLQKKKQQVN